MDLFNKGKIKKLQNEVESYKSAILTMRKEIDQQKANNVKLKEEISNLKFTLKHQRNY
tara:strand:+ start:266 stop:439 length:174 start_codon:yes stop_codon:yes gene_type:complete